MVQRRVELGDAPRLERLQADAALAQAEAQLAQAIGRAQVAAESLRRLYPALTLPPSVPETPPSAVDDDAAGWIAAILEHNHELGVAARSARAIGASRTDAERRPDPAVGVHMAWDKGSEEQVVGLSLLFRSLVPARRADADAAVANAETASWREAGVLRKVEAEAAALHRRARAAWAGWQSQQAAADALGRAPTSPNGPGSWAKAASPKPQRPPPGPRSAASPPGWPGSTPPKPATACSSTPTACGRWTWTPTTTTTITPTTAPRRVQPDPVALAVGKHRDEADLRTDLGFRHQHRGARPPPPAPRARQIRAAIQIDHHPVVAGFAVGAGYQRRR